MYVVHWSLNVSLRILIEHPCLRFLFVRAHKRYCELAKSRKTSCTAPHFSCCNLLKKQSYYIDVIDTFNSQMFQDTYGVESGCSELLM